MRFRFNNERFSIKNRRYDKISFNYEYILGITFNVIGLGIKIQNNPITSGLYATLKSLADLATPLILIIVGYGLKLNENT